MVDASADSSVRGSQLRARGSLANIRTARDGLDWHRDIRTKAHGTMHFLQF